MQTHSVDRVLSKADLKALSARSDWHGAGQIAFHAAFLAAGVALVATAGPWTLLPAMLVLGIAEASLFAPVHETMHMTAFASRRANEVVGWLAACPSLLNWHFYTAFHLAHHRHTQDPDHDPELMPLPPGRIGGYLARVSGVPYWQMRLRVVRDCWRGDLSDYPYVTARAAPRIIRSVRAMSLLMAGLAALSMVVISPWAPLLFWIGPQLLGQPLLRLYLLTEHTLCSHDANGLTNTRTTLTVAPLRRLMWNMSFHTEHHLYPSIPFHRLPDAHRAMAERLGVVQRGYVRWHRDFVSHLRGRASVG